MIPDESTASAMAAIDRYDVRLRTLRDHTRQLKHAREAGMAGIGLLGAIGILMQARSAEVRDPEPMVR